MLTQTASAQIALGTGVYTIPHAAALLRTDTRAVRRWVEGYRRSRKEGGNKIPPLVQRDLEPVDGVALLTFQELVELRLIKLLRDRNLSLPTIRTALAYARRYFDTAHPFATCRILTDGKQIFAELTERDIPDVTRERAVLELKEGEYVMEHLVRDYLEDIDYSDNLALRWWPLGREHLVLLDPTRNSGNPVDPQSGVSSYALIKQVEAGDSILATANWYRVREQAVKDALEFRDYLRAA